MAVVIGLVQGGVQSLSRSYFARLIPAEKGGEYFGFYNMVGKFAAILGPTPEILNNEGFSFMLRGDFKTARKKLLAAKAKDPNSVFIQNNLTLLEEVTVEAKGIKSP